MCLDRICEHFGDSEALISRHQSLRYTYGQLKQQVENAARGMISIGVQKGDRVGVWSPNCAEWLIAQYALAKVGAIMVNINPAYRLRELEHALTQSGVSVIVAARGFRNSNYVAMIDELAPRLPALKQTIYLGRERRGSANHLGRSFRKRQDSIRVRSCANARLRCNATIRSIFNTLRGRRAGQRARRCRTTTF